MWIIFIKWCNWAIPTGHKVGVDWVEAARITFHTKALHLDTLKSGRASLQCFHKVGTALCYGPMTLSQWSKARAQKDFEATLLTYQGGLVSKLLMSPFSRCFQIPGTLKLYSILSLFKCG